MDLIGSCRSENLAEDWDLDADARTISTIDTLHGIVPSSMYELARNLKRVLNCGKYFA